jgi:hypothetical protein
MDMIGVTARRGSAPAFDARRPPSSRSSPRRDAVGRPRHAWGHVGGPWLGRSGSRLDDYARKGSVADWLPGAAEQRWGLTCRIAAGRVRRPPCPRPDAGTAALCAVPRQAVPADAGVWVASPGQRGPAENAINTWPATPPTAVRLTNERSSQVEPWRESLAGWPVLQSADAQAAVLGRTKPTSLLDANQRYASAADAALGDLGSDLRVDELAAVLVP